jgi:hypothetical protein
MTKDQNIEKIISRIKTGCDGGDISWSPKKTIWSDDTNHYFNFLSSDNLTEFQMHLTLDEKTYKISRTDLVIMNGKLPGGFVVCASRDYPDLKEIGERIYQDLVFPNLNVNLKNDILGDIFEGMDHLEKKRDLKIEEIIGDGPVLQGEENNSEMSDNGKGKGFFKKLFGR